MGLNGVKARHGAEAVAFMTGYPKWYRPFLHRLALLVRQSQLSHGVQHLPSFGGHELAADLRQRDAP